MNVRADASPEFAHQPGLAGTGVAAHAQRLGSAFAQLLGSAKKRAEFHLAANKAGAEMARRGQAAGAQPHHRLCFALERLLTQVVELERQFGQTAGLRPDPDLTARRSAHQARGQVDGVAQRPRGTAAELLLTRDDNAGVDGAVQRDGHAGARLDSRTQPRDGVVQFERGTQRAHRVVFVRRRHTEYRHDRVADELLDAALVLRDDFCGGAEDTGQDLARLLRVESLGKLREACQVREQHTDLLALGTLDMALGGKRACAAAADAGIDWILRAAGQASKERCGRHLGRLASRQRGH